MKKSLIALACSSLLAASLSAAAQPADFITVYHAALRNDPTFQQARANEQIAEQNEPLAMASLLPQINLQGNFTYNSDHTSGEIKTLSSDSVPQNGTIKTRALGFTATLTQSIFNFTNWMNLYAADHQVKAAYATYTAAVQSLIQRTAQAYFNVLEAEDNLRYTEAEKRAFYRKYVQAKESFKVGVKTITDVYNAKASYDTSVSDYVSAKTNLSDQRENLRAITGVYYKNLASLKRLPLTKPNPASMEAWVKTAEHHNWNIVAARYTLLAAHDDIRAAFGGHLPSLDFDTSYSNTYTKFLGNSNNTREKDFTAGLELNIPVFSGGEVTAQVRQAIGQYNLAAGQYRYTYRQTLNDTRQNYLGAISGIAKVEADRQAIISNRSSLKGMEEGYKVGTQTMTNVLIAEKDLYDAERSYSKDRFAYIMSLIDLKQAAGTLSVADVMKINSYLVNNNQRRYAKRTVHHARKAQRKSYHK
jgi:outer membrane protein